MLKNYLKIAFRNLFRHKGYSSLNILGLAAGITCCLFIMLYVQFEFSYDDYHEDSDRIFRIIRSVRSEAMDKGFASIPNHIAPKLKDDFPQIETVTRFGTAGMHSVSYGDKVFYEQNMKHADMELFDVFSIPVLQGDISTMLDQRNKVVLTQKTSEKYFGDTTPVGEMIKIDTTYFEVTGVVGDYPPNTQIKFDMLLSIKIIEEDQHRNGWHCPVYVKLIEGADPEVFSEQIKDLHLRYLADSEEPMDGDNIFSLQEINKIHLTSNLQWELEPPGNPLYLYIFSAVGVLILLIACMNFMNLSTARSANRSVEVGLRKVAGAHRSQLIWQFLGESFLLTIIALILAVVSALVFLPYFNGLAGTEFTVKNLLIPEILLGLLLLFVITGLTAGCYPAFFLSAFRPVSILKGSLSSGSRGALMRKMLVVGQFAISITLIIGTIVVYSQLNYMKNLPLGFEKEQKLVVSFLGTAGIGTDAEHIKSEFLQHHSITGAAAASNVLGRWQILWRVWPSGFKDTKTRVMNFLLVDKDFIPEYEIEMAAGRPFREEMSTDNQATAYVLNEAAVKAFEWGNPEEAIGKELWDGYGEIIGVVKDFHFRGVQDAVEPYALGVVGRQFRYITLNLNTRSLEETVAFVKNKYSEMFPESPIEYFFLDEDFDKQYRYEEKTGRLFGVFTILGLIIASLGLFGLASFIAEQRTKEIGIRKVLGASVPAVIFLLTKEFVKWVGLGTLLAWPIAYFAVSRWLDNFAYRIDPGVLAFIGASLLAMVIAVFTVSFQAFRAARSNPADALRYE